MNQTLALLLLCLSWILFPGCGNKPAQVKNEQAARADTASLVFQTDKRVETLYIVFLFSDYPALTRFPNTYQENALVYFEPYKDHPAIGLARELVQRGFVADYAVNWLLQYSQMPALIKSSTIDFPFEARPLNADSLELFRKELANFYTDAHCESFFAAQQSFFDNMLSAVKDSFSRKDMIRVIEDYFGIKKKARYFIIISPLMHSGGFSIERTDVRELYALIGPNGSREGLPKYDRTFLEQDLVIHEFSHNYANPIVDRYMDQTRELEKSLFPPVRELAKQEGYANWEAFLRELMVRAITIRITGMVYGKQAAMEIQEYDSSVGFGYASDLADELSIYESQRDKYPTFTDFYPNIIRRLEQISHRMSRVKL